MKVMDQIRAYVVPKGSIAMWWLGQSGYIFKSPEGTLACVDAYLTNSVAATNTKLNLERRVPVLVAPEDVDVDVYFCTHSHMDHADPETIARLRQRDIPHFVGPHPVCDIYRQKGIESGRIRPAWPDCELAFKDLKMNGTFSLPTDMTDLNHMGYVIQFGGGPKVYITGDTDYSDLLLSAAKHEPQVMITVINAGFNNLSHFEAA